MNNKIILNKIRLDKVKFIVDYNNNDILGVNYSGQNKYSLHWLCEKIKEIKIISTNKEFKIGDYVDLNICLFVCNSGNIYEVFGWC